MYITNILMKTNIGHNNMPSRTVINNTENPVTPANTVLQTPCDTKYMLNCSNINFGAKYKIKKLKLEEFEKVSKEVLEKAEDMGIRFDWLQRDHLTKYESKNSDIIVQTFKILFNHKIIKLESVKDNIDHMITSIGVNSSPLGEINNMLEFADFITSSSVKSVYKNESVQDEMGDILYSILSNDSIDYKKKFVQYINDNKELLLKDVKIGKYIEAIDKNSYDTVLNNLLKKEPPINPLEGLKTPQVQKQGGLFGALFGPKTEETKKSFGKVVTKSKDGLSGFARVGGQSKAIEQLEDTVIFPIQYPHFYKGIGTEKGTILYGPPGTGKSLMAEALAEELGRYYVKIGAGDMENKFVGGTKDQWIALFNDLKEHQPSLLFIDEFDALAKKRDGRDVHGDKQLNCFLKLVSDIEAENLDVYMLSATNKEIKELDPAVIRDCRFGNQIKVDNPATVNDVKEIFNIHTNGLPLDKDVIKNKNTLCRMMFELGLNGSAIKGVVKSANINAIKRLGLRDKMKAKTVTKADENSFNFKYEDFLKAIQNRDKKITKRKPIGFNQA